MDDVIPSQVNVVLWFVVNLVLYAGPFAFLYLAYLTVSLPMRRRESARLFLSLLELGLQDGLALEQAILQAAQQNDTALGRRFHSSSAHLQSGMPVEEMLQKLRDRKSVG